VGPKIGLKVLKRQQSVDLLKSNQDCYSQDRIFTVHFGDVYELMYE